MSLAIRPPRGSFAAGWTLVISVSGGAWSSWKKPHCTLIPEWGGQGPETAGRIPASYGHTFRDARVKSFVDTLRKDSALFARAWKGKGPASRRRNQQHSPSADWALSFYTVQFQPVGATDYKLVIPRPAPLVAPRPSPFARTAPPAG